MSASVLASAHVYVSATSTASRLDVQSFPFTGTVPASLEGSQLPVSRVYKRRWLGLVAIVSRGPYERRVTERHYTRQIFLNIVGGMPLVWFGPIADSSRSSTVTWARTAYQGVLCSRR